jgi:hypothetical protein
MKIRNGFVSNSSSSSFVVAFPKKPETIEELKHMMFGNVSSGYIECYDDSISEMDCTETVFGDLVEHSLTRDEIIEELSGSFHLDGIKEDDITNSELKEKIRKYES